MPTLKESLYELCGEVASELQDWSFVSGRFKNKALKHSTRVIDPGFSFARDSTPLHPAIRIDHKRSMALFKKLNGYDFPTSIVSFQEVAQLLTHVPEKLRLNGWILGDKATHVRLLAPSGLQASDSMIDVTECRPVLRSMLLDGIDLIGKFYDFSSEESFLRNFPPKYTTRSEKSPYGEFEGHKGVMVCIVHALLGDFDFVENYASDRYPTIFPKRTQELAALVAALPGLKDSYARTGVVR
jgi:hypothetical protein